MKWEKLKVFDVCELAYGKSLTSDSRIPGEYPVYGSAGEVGTHTNYLVEGPGIIIGRKGSVGTLYYEKRNFFPIDTSYYVVPKENYDLRFLYYKFQTLGLDKLNSDAAVPGLNRNVAYEQSSVYPPLPTQRKIASILSAYDDLIENNLKRIKLLEEKAFARYKSEFDFFKPSNDNNRLPEGWCVKRADEIFKINIGKTPPREQSEWFNDVDSKVKWVSIKDINNSTVFVFETSETVTEMAVSMFNMNIAKAQTVLLSFKLTVGKVAITTEDMTTNEAIAHFNIEDESEMCSEYIYFYLKNFPYDSLGSTSSIGTAINSKVVKAMPVLLPSKKVINEYKKDVEMDFALILNLLKQNTKLREARDILLPKLMNGQIEV
ncbi:MAG: restriction endonuclease subunit S [Bacteroidetes bacterium]|nr:restriction endonuclease subunit S [Bacteroidota bacterium]